MWSQDVDFAYLFVSCPDTGPEAFCYGQELKDSRDNSTQCTHLCSSVSANQNILEVMKVQRSPKVVKSKKFKDVVFRAGPGYKK